MIDVIEADTLLPPVMLQELPDGSVEILNGHHRCAAYYLAGRNKLEPWEYELVLVDYDKSKRCCLLSNFLLGGQYEKRRRIVDDK